MAFSVENKRKGLFSLFCCTGILKAYASNGWPPLATQRREPARNGATQWKAETTDGERLARTVSFTCLNPDIPEPREPMDFSGTKLS